MSRVVQSNPMSGRNRARQKRSPLAFFALGVMFLVGVGSIAFSIVFPVPQFPVPTGPYKIGTHTYHWVDTTRPEPFTARKDDQRELMVQVWYPSNASEPKGHVPYLSSPELRDALATFLRLPGFALSNVQHASTHAVAGTEPSPGQFPVLVNPTGFIGYRDASLFWIEELVSHGYVVVGSDQPGTAAATVLPDDRVIPAMAPEAAFKRYMPLALAQSGEEAPLMNGVRLPGGIIPFLAQDMQFILSQIGKLNREDSLLGGHLDVARAGIFGVSLGGYTGPEACRRDPRFRACLVADAGQTEEVARQGLAQPVMIMTRDAAVFRQERAQAGGWPEPEIVHTLKDQRALFERSTGGAYYLRMNTMFHLNWTDAPILTPLVKWVGLAGPIDAYRGFAATNAYTVAFFDKHLKGKPAPLLRGSSPWPEVKFKRRPVLRGLETRE